MIGVIFSRDLRGSAAHEIHAPRSSLHASTIVTATSTKKTSDACLIPKIDKGEAEDSKKGCHEYLEGDRGRGSCRR